MAYGQNIQAPNFANAMGQTPSERWRFSTLNDMLLSINQAGLDYNDSIMDTMEGQHALRILTDVMYDIEELGWEFNTFGPFEITLNDQGRFTWLVDSVLPASATYAFSMVGASEDYVVDVNGAIHKMDVSESFDTSLLGDAGATIQIESIIVEKWQNMPYALSQYVAAMAINRYQVLMIGDSAQAQFSKEDIQQKYVDARRGEIRQGKYNVLTSPFGVSVNR